MSLDASSLIAGLVVSGIGYVLFTYGRKQARPPQILGGLLLMVFPYFVPSVPWMLLVAAALCGLVWVSVRAGY
jgi:hypothetical protein